MTERELMAAEYALGLLDAEERLEARGLVASDPAFARSVESWQEKLAPLFEEIGEERPPQDAWERVRAAIAAERPAGGNVVALKRKLGFWKGMSAAASAIAASLALVVAYDITRPPAPAVQPRAEVMVAALMSEDKDMMLSAAWRPDERSLMLMPGEMAPAPGRSHELWIIPADGTPRSLGVIEGRQMRMPVDPAMAPHFAGPATLAISVEPVGGSPGDLPTGPVVATGQLQKV